MWFTASLAAPGLRIEDENMLQFEHIEEGVSLDYNNVPGGVMELNRLRSNSRVMSRLELSLVRCCSSVLDTFHEVARCFEVNGFGGINFSRRLCTLLDDVSELH